MGMLGSWTLNRRGKHMGCPTQATLECWGQLGQSRYWGLKRLGQLFLGTEKDTGRVQGVDYDGPGQKIFDLDEAWKLYIEEAGKCQLDLPDWDGAHNV